MLTLPGMFRQRDEDGIAEAYTGEVPEELRKKVLLAVSQCPVAAIHILDDDETEQPLGIHEEDIIDVQRQGVPD